MAPPEPQIAAIDRLGEALVASFERPRPRERARFAMATALALVVLATIIVATPPGQAVANWVGDLLGLTDDTRPETDAQRAANAALIATDVAPDGERYAVYADLDTDEGLCFLLYLDEERRLLNCRREGIARNVEVPAVSRYSPETLVVQGVAPADTAELAVTYERSPDAPAQTAPSSVFSVDEALGEKLGIEPQQGYAFFIAFLPAGTGDVTGPSRAEAVAYDERRGEIGRSPIRWVDPNDGELPLMSCTAGNEIARSYCAADSTVGSSPDP